MALPKLKTKHLILVGLLALWSGIGLYATQNPQANSELSAEPDSDFEAEPISLEEAFPYVIPNQSTLFSVLRVQGISPQTIEEIVQASKPVYDLKNIRAGVRFQLLRENQPSAEVLGITFRFSPVEQLEIKKENGIWTAAKIVEEVNKKVVTFNGVVNSSLWESAEKANMDPNLISDLAEIFAWEVDFSREVRVKDRWRLSVEQKFVRGEPIGWGDILAAEYENAGEIHKAVLFRKEGENLGYFTPEGASLRKMFLKSPIRYGRISSKFQRKRFHPVLGINRPHLGVDYAAPIGTPIRAVGDGVVIFAGWSGGGGKVIKIRHNSTYQTAYKHLNGYAKGVRNGARIRQGDVIGYVGNTGLSTGPHLHFEFFQAGVFVDPLGKKFPSADPVPQKLLGEFKSSAVQLLELLPNWEKQEVVMRDTASENLPEAAN